MTIQNIISSSNKLCLHELFENAVREDPDKTAIIYSGLSLSYLELNQHANQVSNFLLSRGIKPGSFVGLLTERSVEMVIGYMAILKAGCVVVPLDTENPPDRQRFFLQDSNIKCILLQQHLAIQFDRNKIPLIPIDLDNAVISEASCKNPELNINLNSVALIIYTSGSTGHPKGVMISHDNLNHYVEAIQKYFNLTKSDIYLHRGRISLIVSVRQLFVPLAIGSTVVITTKVQSLDPLKLFKLIKDYKVTIVDHVPSFWLSLEHFVSTLEAHEKLSFFDTKVRLIAAGGEAITERIVKFWFDNFNSGTEFYNIYGQTEGTGVVSSYKITEIDLGGMPNISIGRAVNNMQLYILDKNLCPVKENEPGEIYISGNGVAMGYLNQPELTAEKFISIQQPNSEVLQTRLYKTDDLGLYRSDDTIKLLGRIDDQVHIKGHRIELNEIQITLSTHPLIAAAQVISHREEHGGQILLAFLVSSAAQRPVPDEIRRFLLKKIPEYMVPSKYIILDTFPLTKSGKVDRQLLSSENYTHLKFEQNDYYSPITDLHHRLVEIWQKVLRIGKVGIGDNFFNLGGDSLKGVELICQIEKALGYIVPIEALHQISTIERMAEAIESKKDSTTNYIGTNLTAHEYKKMVTIIACCGIPRLKPQSLILAINENGTLPPLFWCFNAPRREMSALADLLPENQPLYGLLSSVPLDNNQSALESVAAHYVDELLSLYPEGPFILGGNCRGAKVICEIYNLLQQKQIRVDKICLLEFFHPYLYQFDAELMLLFGEHSDLKRHELLNWMEDGWEKPFKNIPEVYWIPCKHGVFFNTPNIEKLAMRVKQLLYG